MPKREMSKRGAPVAIISIAQHARPKVTGQSEPLRDRPAIFSTVVSRKPDGAASSIPMVSPSSRPLEAAAAPLVQVGHRDDDQEEHRRDEAEQRELREVDGPLVQEHDLDVEDDEEIGRATCRERAKKIVLTFYKYI